MVELKHAPTKEGGLNLRVPNGNVALVIVGILDKHEWGCCYVMIEKTESVKKSLIFGIDSQAAPMTC